MPRKNQESTVWWKIKTDNRKGKEKNKEFCFFYELKQLKKDFRQKSIQNLLRRLKEGRDFDVCLL